MAQALVVVSDTSAIIDLNIAGLLEALPSLPYAMVIPAPLFENELLDFTADEKSELKRIGFEVRHLPGEGVTRAMEYFHTYAALSLNDCFALSQKIQKMHFCSRETKNFAKPLINNR